MRTFLSFFVLVNGLFAAQLCQFDLASGRFIPMTGHPAKATVSALSNVFTCGESSAVCTLTEDDIRKVLSIIDDTQSYLKGIQDVMLLGCKSKKRILGFEPRIRTKVEQYVYSDLVRKRNGLLSALSVKLFIDNLNFVRNTISYSLSNPKLRNGAFRQLVKEIRAINHWFSSTGRLVEIMSSFTRNNYLETLSDIFSGLKVYFPSNDLPSFGNLFAVLNGSTRVETMDQVNVKKYTAILDKFDADILDFKKRRLSEPWRIAALKELKARGTPCKELVGLYEKFNEDMLAILTNTDPEVEKLCRAIGQPAEVQSDESYVQEEHVRYLERLKQQERLRQTAQKATLQIGQKLEQVVCERQDPNRDKDLGDDIYCPVAKLSQSLPLSAVSEEAIEGLSCVVQLGDDAEVDFDPVVEHFKHQQRKRIVAACPAAAAAVGAVACAEPVDALDSLELRAFLHDAIYSHTPCSWREFECMMTRHGFEIIPKSGNVRQIQRVGTYQKFTVHRPNDEVAPLLYKYLSFIRSGLSHVFRLTPDAVAGL